MKTLVIIAVALMSMSGAHAFERVFNNHKTKPGIWTGPMVETGFFRGSRSPSQEKNVTEIAPRTLWRIDDTERNVACYITFKDVSPFCLKTK